MVISSVLCRRHGEWAGEGLGVFTSRCLAPGLRRSRCWGRNISLISHKNYMQICSLLLVVQYTHFFSRLCWSVSLLCLQGFSARRSGDLRRPAALPGSSATKQFLYHSWRYKKEKMPKSFKSTNTIRHEHKNPSKYVATNCGWSGIWSVYSLY